MEAAKAYWVELQSNLDLGVLKLWIAEVVALLHSAEIEVKTPILPVESWDNLPKIWQYMLTWVFEQ